MYIILFRGGYYNIINEKSYLYYNINSLVLLRYHRDYNVHCSQRHGGTAQTELNHPGGYRITTQGLRRYLFSTYFFVVQKENGNMKFQNRFPTIYINDNTRLETRRAIRLKNNPCNYRTCLII